MYSEMDLYCKLFVETKMDRAALVRFLAQTVTGTENRSTIVSPWGEMDVMMNDDYDEERAADPHDGFLYYRYYLDIEPAEDADPREYIKGIARMLEALWESGAKAVAACDFEEELPRKGGIAGE
ncbi:1,4-dihydroxy-6-naphthoate synthase [Brevibacillus sp. B_LB10_24]